MNKIQDWIQKIIDLGKHWPAWKNEAKVQSDIANILGHYSLKEQQQIDAWLNTLWQSYTPEQKQNLLGIPYEVYKQVQNNINKAPEPEISNPNTPETEDTPVDTSWTPTITDPVDPEEHPNDVYWNEDTPDFTDPTLAGESEVRTRGQKITSDAHDYGTEYPWKTENLDIDHVANYVLDYSFLYDKDKDRLSQLKTRKEQIHHLKDIIQNQRNEVEEKKLAYSFDYIVNECYEVIPEYLEKEFGPELAKKFNELTNKKKIHLLGAYDFQKVTGKKKSNACGIFRTRDGDIYVNLEYLKKQENKPPIAVTPTSEFPRIYWEIKSTLVHELLHSQSVLNYRWKNADWRRIGLANINYKNNLYRGNGYNEATTEHLTQDIMKYWYTIREWLNPKQYKAPWISYEDEQNIVWTAIQEINKNDDSYSISWNDFQKAMILRKYENDNQDIKQATPLVELIRKMNWGNILQNQKRPYFFQLVMELIDILQNLPIWEYNSHKRNIYEQAYDRILCFIKTKDLTLIRPFRWGIRNTTLLNKEKTDFNNLILEKYSSHENPKQQRQFHPDGSEYVDFEEVKQ